MTNDIMVSVICNTFNQEKYIRDALEGIIRQKASFKYEILVHDDASTDKTQEIIKEYEKKYPDLLKPIYQNNNQYQNGVNITNVYQIPRAKGKYIAFCEGDDYWIDEQKLQLQVDALERHPMIDMCGHTVKIEQNGIIKGKVEATDRDGLLSVEKVILNGGAYIGTCSLMFRSSISKDMPRFRKKYSMDYTMQIHGALRGGVLYLNREMGVYRIGAEGSWTERILRNPQKAVIHYNRMLEILDVINEDTQKQYEYIIDFVKKEYMFKKYYAQNDSIEMKKIAEELKKKNNPQIYKLWDFKDAIKMNIKYTFPFLYKYLHKK